jgi:phosphoribosyl 1,2-cyclic phosphodiesterase
MKFASLASGSSGNCFVLENNNKELTLFDAGISCKQTFNRLNELELNPRKIKNIFISHEHSDHIKGVDVLKKKTDANIFMTKKTFLNSKLRLSADQINFIKNEDSIKLQDLEIRSIPKFHDAADPVSFVVHNKNKTFSVLTDIGKENQAVIDAVAESNSVILESNHDPYMLSNCRYPAILKKRISSDFGHLSNIQASLLTLEYISELNNMLKTFNKIAIIQTNISVFISLILLEYFSAFLVSFKIS